VEKIILQKAKDVLEQELDHGTKLVSHWQIMQKKKHRQDYQDLGMFLKGDVYFFLLDNLSEPQNHFIVVDYEHSQPILQQQPAFLNAFLQRSANDLFQNKQNKTKQKSQ